MAGVDFKNPLSIRIVVFLRELFGPVRSGGGVHAPDSSMGNDGRGNIPIVELREELAGRGDGFGAIDWEFANRHAFWASTHRLNFIQLGHHVVATRKREGSQAE